MQLPNDSIGISDILAYRDCARRMTYGMRRHIAEGEQSKDRNPEARNPGALYGSAIHDAIKASADGFSDEDAIQIAWAVWGSFLDPDDHELLANDLAIYHTRDFSDVRVVMVEDEIKIPLIVFEDRQIWFRAKIDRLYESLVDPGHFLHIDYKSSKWLRSAEEVHNDLQMGSYNVAIHEDQPRCNRLSQFYDQLRGGQVPTSRSQAQRDKIFAWLGRQVRTILQDERWQEDGFLPFQHNQWCPWCPILESCHVVEDLTDYALTRIAALAPIVKEGRRLVVQLDTSRVEEYVAEFDHAKAAKGILEKFTGAVSDMLKEMPTGERLALGYDLKDRKNTEFNREAKRQIHEATGELFYDLVTISKAALERTLVDEPEVLAFALDQGLEVAGSPALWAVSK